MGGAEAAYQLHNEIQAHIQSYDGAKQWKVLVRVYIDIDALFQALNEAAFKIKKGTLHQFSQGFTQNYPLFDLVNVGRGRAHVEKKMEGNSLIELLFCRFIAHRVIEQRFSSYPLGAFNVNISS